MGLAFLCFTLVFFISIEIKSCSGNFCNAAHAENLSSTKNKCSNKKLLNRKLTNFIFLKELNESNDTSLAI